jgi:hypothetical protein
MRSWTRSATPYLDSRRDTRETSAALELDPDALVDAALGFVAGDADRADLAGVRDVRAAIGLEVEPDDLDRPDLGDALGQEVDWSG